jgi:hypothetical protein
MYLYYFLECFECFFLIFKNKVEEACYEIHALAVLYLWVEECVGFKNISQNYWIDLARFSE